MKKTKLWAAIALLLLVIAAVGIYLWKTNSATKENTAGGNIRNGVVQDDSGRVVKYWYDPMVPDQRFDKPGKSPFMDMELVPKYADENKADSAVSISPQTVQNLGIRLAEVTRETLGSALTAVARVEADERAYYAVQTRVPGFVERLYVRAEGDPVSKGQKIAEVYAPDLLAAQHEYLALLDMQGVEGINELRQAARTRLKLLGMGDAEINRIAKRREASARIGIYSPASGIVAELGAREGAQLLAGSTLMQIADLSKVWLIAEIPERHAGRIAIGTPVEVQLQGGSAEPVIGKVSYIYPTLDQIARVVRARIELANPQGLLRPGMYATVEFTPESREALTVPSESIIETGRRTVVIVKDTQGFRPVEVKTGRESGGRTEILSGLSKGDQVVVSGQFLIDSEASLSGVLDRLSGQQNGQAGHDMPAMETPAPAAIQVTGKVVSLNPGAGTITLSHDPIPALEWPSMTMGFRVADTEQLQGLKKGDAVEFSLLLDEASDEYVIQEIEPVMHDHQGSMP